MSPPENAVVLCIDEKPSIQALERAQGHLKLPSGRAGGRLLRAPLHQLAELQLELVHQHRRALGRVTEPIVLQLGDGELQGLDRMSVWPVASHTRTLPPARVSVGTGIIGATPVPR
jgi:hypothetical protein